MELYLLRCKHRASCSRRLAFDEDLKGEKIIRDKVKEQSDRDLAEEQQLILNGDDEGTEKSTAWLWLPR